MSQLERILNNCSIFEANEPSVMETENFITRNGYFIVYTSDLYNYMTGQRRFVVYFGENNPYNIVKFVMEPTNTSRVVLEACISALQVLEKLQISHVEINSSSGYLRYCLNMGLKIWPYNGWKKVDGDDVRNQDLLHELLKLTKSFDDVYCNMLATTDAFT